MPPSSATSAIILAAGYSRRMGQFKPLLTLGGQTVLDRVVSLYRQIGVTDIRVVTGFRAQAIQSALAVHPVTVVHNPGHDQGMFSSVRIGVDTLGKTVGSFFIHPVDIPLVRPHTLITMLQAFDEHPSAVVYAVFDSQRGHPPLINGELRGIISGYDGRGGLRSLLVRYDSAALAVQVADQGVLLDLDCPDDFRRLSARLATFHHLTIEECRVLLQTVQRLPRSLIEHCRQVARVAGSLASAVNSRGGTLDIPLIQSAAWVHDVAKGNKHHAAVAADLLADMGFPAMAAIINAHMDIADPGHTPLDEAQIVYLADKLLEGSTLMCLAARFKMKLKKYGHEPQVAENINRRWRAATMIQDKVEQAMGESIEQFLRKTGIEIGISNRQQRPEI